MGSSIRVLVRRMMESPAGGLVVTPAVWAPPGFGCRTGAGTPRRPSDWPATPGLPGTAETRCVLGTAAPWPPSNADVRNGRRDHCLPPIAPCGWRWSQAAAQEGLALADRNVVAE